MASKKGREVLGLVGRLVEWAWCGAAQQVGRWKRFDEKPQRAVKFKYAQCTVLGEICKQCAQWATQVGKHTHTHTEEGGGGRG